MAKIDWRRNRPVHEREISDEAMDAIVARYRSQQEPDSFILAPSKSPFVGTILYCLACPTCKRKGQVRMTPEQRGNRRFRCRKCGTLI